MARRREHGWILIIWSFISDSSTRTMANPTFSLGLSADTICSGPRVEDETQSPTHLDDVDSMTVAITEQLSTLNCSLELPVFTAEMVEPAMLSNRSPFLDEDDEFQRVLAEGGANPSRRVDQWAVNRLNEFRVFKGLDASVPFEDLAPTDIVVLLKKFFEQVCKMDDALYPTQTLMGLYRAFHRMLCKKQEARVQESGTDEPVFQMRASPLFKPVGIACVLAMERSKKAGANVPRKKAVVISKCDEAVILDHLCTSKGHPRGLQRRVAFFLLCRFGIRGGSELYGLLQSDFTVGKDDAGTHIRFNDRLSKNYKVSLERYQDEHFRPAVLVHDGDVVETFQALYARLPEKSTHLFYQCIDNPRTSLWYSSLRVSQKTLTKLLKEMHVEAGISAEVVTNKSGRTTCVTRMASEGVPPHVGMRVTGHKSEGAYKQYDRSVEAQVRAAQRCASEGSGYEQNVRFETCRLREAMEGTASGGVPQDDTSPMKRAKLVGVEENQSGDSMGACSEAIDLEVAAIDAEGPKGALDLVMDGKYSEFNWVDDFDWENLGTVWKEGGDAMKAVNINPMNALFGKIANMTNCTVSINIGNFQSGTS